MTQPETTEIDLRKATQGLQKRFERLPPVGYVTGKTSIRDAVLDLYECSMETAEAIVDQLESRGFARYQGDRAELDQGTMPWVFDPSPPCVS